MIKVYLLENEEALLIEATKSIMKSVMKLAH